MKFWIVIEICHWYDEGWKQKQHYFSSKEKAQEFYEKQKDYLERITSWHWHYVEEPEEYELEIDNMNLEW